MRYDISGEVRLHVKGTIEADSDSEADAKAAKLLSEFTGNNSVLSVSSQLESEVWDVNEE